MRKVTQGFLLSFLLLFVFFNWMSTSSLSAQELSEKTKLRPPPTQSAYLLDLAIGKSNVNLNWEGYWRASFVAGNSFGKKTPETVYPGLTRGVSFFQEPDVNIALWLNNRWFLETTFQEGFERNTYRAGYVGLDDEFVQEVTIGNSGVNATSYAEIEVPAPRRNTPGITGKFATLKSKHELLIRYDMTETDKKYFKGNYEIKKQNIGLSDFIEGKYFVLPDKNVSHVVVYLEDRLGSIIGTERLGVIRKYRLAEPGEFFVDGQSGLLELNKSIDGQVAVSYNTSFGAVGSPGGGVSFIVPPDAKMHPDLSKTLTDFSWSEFDPYDQLYNQKHTPRTYAETSRVIIGGKTALILYSPERFTPFERQNVYLSSRPIPEETWRITPMIENRGSLYPKTSPGYEFIPDIRNKSISVYASIGSSEGLRSPMNRYPFASADPESYGPGRETDMKKLSKIIVLGIREPNPGYHLGTGIVPGSVTVRINGVLEKNVVVSNDGSITFKRFIYLEDWIEVSFRTEALDMKGGDLFMYQGNHFQLGPGINLELAESIRWNISPDRTVHGYNKSPGEVKVASTLDWKRDTMGIRLTGGLSLTTPDTAGNLRLFSMDEGEMRLVFLHSTLVSSPDSVPGFGLTTRKSVEKYNYTSYDVLGKARLNDYLWKDATRNGDGPAIATRRSGDPVNGRVMELRFDGGAQQWHAGDFLADHRGPITLSGYTGIVFPVKFLNDYGTAGLSGTTPGIILQAGEIGESKDHHGDGVVNRMNPGSMVEWDLSTNPETSSAISKAWTSPGIWQMIHITLTPRERTRLDSVRSFRLIINNNTGSPISGRVILGPPHFEGSPFRTEIRRSTNALAPNQHIAGSEVKDNSLKTAHPEIAELFHPDGKSNKTLAVRWGTDVPGGTDLAPGNRWEVVSWFSGIPMNAYQNLVFYFRNDDISGIGPLTARITDENDQGIVLSWISSHTGWDRITVNIPQGTAVSTLGNIISSVRINRNARALSRFILTGSDATGNAAESDNSGTFYLDEVHFRDPSFTLAGDVEFQGYWQYPGNIAFPGDFPILGNIKIDARAIFSGEKVLASTDSGRTALTGSITASADILGASLKTDWQGTWGRGKNTWSGSHSLRIPAQKSIVWFRDSYSRGGIGDKRFFSRNDEVNLILKPGSLRVFGSSLYDGISLIQSWGGETAWKMNHWNTKLEIRYIMNSEDFPDVSENYFSSWIKDFRLLAPARGTIINREIHHTFDGGTSWKSVSLEWHPQLRMKSARAPVWNQKNHWSGTLSLPLRFNDWSLTPSYRRDLTQVINTSATGNRSYSDVWNTFINGIRGQFPLFTYLPFRELFGKEDGRIFTRSTQGMMEARYEAEAGITLHRTSGSGILDLFVPSTGDFSIERRYTRKGDTTGWENEWRGSLEFSTINLFGQFGRFPLIPWYNFEIFSSLIQMTLKDFNGISGPRPHEFLWQINGSFIGSKKHKLILDNRLLWSWDPQKRETRQEGKVEYQWRTTGKNTLHLPLVKKVIRVQHHVESRERLIFTGRFPWADSPSDSGVNFGITLYHESSWVFQDLGHLKGWLALGMGAQKGVFTNGWELGIEVEFRF